MTNPALHVGAVALLAAAEGCGNVGLPGQPGYMATLTVINRTVDRVEITSGEGGPHSIAVPACEEVTAAEFPVNFWNLTGPGRDSYHSGGGISVGHSYLLVTGSPMQLEQRPETLPPCEGLLPPAQPGP